MPPPHHCIALVVSVDEWEAFKGVGQLRQYLMTKGGPESISVR